MIVGCGGSGKSTLALNLSKLTGLKVIHLDRISWRPGWIKRSQDEMNSLIQNAIQEDGWICEGENAASFKLRANRAHMIVWIDLPRRICLRRVIWRTITHYGKARPGLYDDCHERFSWEYCRFLKWIWNFRKNIRPQIELMMCETKGELQQVIIRNHRDWVVFLDNIKKDVSKTTNSIFADN